MSPHMNHRLRLSDAVERCDVDTVHAPPTEWFPLLTSQCRLCHSPPHTKSHNQKVWASTSSKPTCSTGWNAHKSLAEPCLSQPLKVRHLRRWRIWALVRAPWPSLNSAPVSPPGVSLLIIFFLITAEQVNVIVLIVLCWCGSLPGSGLHLTHRRHEFVCLLVWFSHLFLLWSNSSSRLELCM